MAKSTRIRVMLSSRCKDYFPAGSKSTMTDLRKQIKQDIEAIQINGTNLFEVWINEDAPPSAGTVDSWDTCLQAVRDCDILIVLFNGNAGWASAKSDVGICHAEFMEGMRAAQAKVRLVTLTPLLSVKGTRKDSIHRRFQEAVAQSSLFRGDDAETVEEAQRRVREALADALLQLTRLGVNSVAASRQDMGAALDWTRMDFRRRKQAMEQAVCASLSGLRGAKALDGATSVLIDGTPVAVVAHAVPAALGVAAARELVGRPFLTDHEREALLRQAQGPFHLIACHRTATETQATALLGFPDATVISGPFGVFVADDIQKVQFAFLPNCRDESQTRHAVQRFFAWLEQSQEAVNVARRAASRTRIVRAIAKETNGK